MKKPRLYVRTGALTGYTPEAAFAPATPAAGARRPVRLKDPTAPEHEPDARPHVIPTPGGFAARGGG